MNRTEKNIQKFKAIELISTFSTLELKRFGRFLQSPYHNNNEDLIHLFDFLRTFYPTFDNPKINRTKIWKKLYKSTPFQVIKFKKLFSELNLLAEEFIVLENLKSDKRVQQKQLIAALEKRHFKRFVKESEALIGEIEAKKEYQSQEDFLDLHLLYQGLWYHIEWEKHKHKMNLKELIASHEVLMHYIEFNKLRAISEIEAMKKILILKELTLPESLKVSKKNLLINSNMQFHFLSKCYEFEIKPSSKAYFSLKKQVFDNYHFLDRNLLQDGVLHLHNYLLKEVALGKIGLHKEIFDLLKWVAENGIFIDNNYIQEGIFNNTVIYALKNKQIAWAEDYIKKNQQYLKSSFNDLLIGYLNASIAYINNDFYLVLNTLITLQPSHNIQYYFYFKSLITRSYFELILQGDTKCQESLKNELEAFEKGVKRNRKFSENRKINYLNFIKILKQLSSLLFADVENEALEILRTKIITTTPLAQRQWLIEKIELLQKKNSCNKFLLQHC